VIYERPYLSTYDQWEAPHDVPRGAAGKVDIGRP
jgi:hypothetical protein